VRGSCDAHPPPDAAPARASVDSLSKDCSEQLGGGDEASPSLRIFDAQESALLEAANPGGAVDTDEFGRSIEERPGLRAAVATMGLQEQFIRAVCESFTSRPESATEDGDLYQMAAGRMRGRGRKR